MKTNHTKDTMPQSKSNDEIKERMKRVHNIGVCPCCDNLMRIREVELAQKDTEVADWQESLEVVAHRFEEGQDDMETFLRKVKNITKSLTHPTKQTED